MSREGRVDRHLVDETHPDFFGVQMYPDRVAVFVENGKRKMESSLFFEEDVMRTLGLYEDALRLYKNIGWGEFFESTWVTYRGPTLEMLSTFKVHTEMCIVHHHIIFWAGNTDYNLCMHVINDFLGAPHGGGSIRTTIISPPAISGHSLSPVAHHLRKFPNLFC